METYTLVITEDDDRSGLMGDVYTDDGTIAESVFLDYDDYGLRADGDADPDERRRETTADVTTLNLDVARDDGSFQLRLLGDGSRELLTERVGDDEWRLSAE